MINSFSFPSSENTEIGKLPEMACYRNRKTKSK